MSRNSSSFRVEILLGQVLRYGVILCAAVIALGIGLSFFFPGQLDPPLGKFIGEVLQGGLVAPPQFLACRAGEWALCLANPNAVIMAGLLLLIALPVVRVALTMVVFLVQRDRTYFFITATVLCLLLFGFYLGREL